MTLTASVLLIHLQIAGVLLAVLVAINLYVPHRFRWREEMAGLSLLNRQIFQAHSAFIILTLALFSALLLTSADALLEPTRMSRAVLIGLTIFWGARALAQWLFYSPAIWRGNRFNTVMHGVFSVVWVYFATTFGAALYYTFTVR
jgi:hypothetical protein